MLLRVLASTVHACDQVIVHQGINLLRLDVLGRRRLIQVLLILKLKTIGVDQLRGRLKDIVIIHNAAIAASTIGRGTRWIPF